MSDSSGTNAGGDRWSQALILPGYTSLFDSMVHELGEYLGENDAEVSSRCDDGGDRVSEEWHSAGLGKESQEAQIADFYKSNRNYLYELTKFNSQYPHPPELEYLLRAADTNRFKTYMDFGSGIGSVGIFFARNGLDVTLADVSPHLLDYAVWRFKRRGLNVNVIDLNHDKLPMEKFDLVTSLDVFEHLPQPRSVLGALARGMKPGGLLGFNVSWQTDVCPQHITSYEDVACGVRASGFRQVKVLHDVHIVKRVSTSPIILPLYSGVDYVWFKLVRRPVLWTLERLQLKERVKKYIRGK